MNFNFEASRFERTWARQALSEFYEDGWLTDVLYRAKGGKEANVYCCRVDTECGPELVAAKVYRHRRQRSMKNYSQYREGRHITSDRRQQRALRKKTRKGKEVADTAWIRQEYDIIDQLYSAGAAVPAPLILGDTALLMEFVGDEHRAAPLLHETALPPAGVEELFDKLMRNVELFLACGIIHGDLSAYNVLYWKEDVTVIDFPQAVDPVLNPSAFSLLARDVERICQYFASYGLERSHMDITTDLWERFLSRRLMV